MTLVLQQVEQDALMIVVEELQLLYLDVIMVAMTLLILDASIPIIQSFALIEQSTDNSNTTHITENGSTPPKIAKSQVKRTKVSYPL
jgi:hypothetical protein